MIEENERYINFINETVIRTQQEAKGTVPKPGTFIRRFMRQHGIAQSEIMAFGDGENDIQMLKFASVGIAMGNADDEVKAAADYVTDSVDENGIEKALRHFHLID